MATCDVCGNDYAHPIEITYNGKKNTFDSFECAVHLLAPVCAHCGCKVIGHGVQAGETIYCCAHCAKKAGASGARDHV